MYQQEPSPLARSVASSVPLESELPSAGVRVPAREQFASRRPNGRRVPSAIPYAVAAIVAVVVLRWCWPGATVSDVPNATSEVAATSAPPRATEQIQPALMPATKAERLRLADESLRGLLRGLVVEPTADELSGLLAEAEIHCPDVPCAPGPHTVAGTLVLTQTRSIYVRRIPGSGATEWSVGLTPGEVAAADGERLFRLPEPCRTSEDLAAHLSKYPSDLWKIGVGRAADLALPLGIYAGVFRSESGADALRCRATIKVEQGTECLECTVDSLRVPVRLGLQRSADRRRVSVVRLDEIAGQAAAAFLRNFSHSQS